MQSILIYNILDVLGQLITYLYLVNLNVSLLFASIKIYLFFSPLIIILNF